MSSGSSSPPVGSDHGIFGSSGIGGFGYGLGVSIGILLLIFTVALAVYFCTRTSMPVAAAAFLFAPAPAPPHHQPFRGGGGDVEQGQGIDEATLATFPAAVPYAELARKAREGRGEEAQARSTCHVCLESYADRDVVRALPDCGHLFHRACVDPWLRLRPTCPVCRTSPLPSPLPTPLAEVTPLAAATR